MAEGERRTVDPDLGPRWTDGPVFGEDRSREAEAIELFRAATSLPGFSSVSSQRVWRRLRAARPGGPRRRWLRPAVVLGLALAAGSAAAACLAVIRAFSPPAAPAAAPAVAPSAPVAPRAVAHSATSVAPAEAPPAEAVEAVGVAPARPAPAAAKAPRQRRVQPSIVPAPVAAPAPGPASAPPPAEEGTLGRETALFREALALRAARASRAAIAALDRYTALHPAGSYAAEVTVLRGELTADTGDCAAAIASFDRALRAPTSPGLEERALYGRATCRQRSGDLAGARGDLRRYLERFPAGRWAGHARNGLK